MSSYLTWLRVLLLCQKAFQPFHCIFHATGGTFSRIHQVQARFLRLLHKRLLPVPVPAPRFSATFCKWWRYSRTQPFRQHLSPPVARGILLCICRGKMSINCGNASECPYIVSQSSDLRFAEKTSSKKRFDFCLNCNMSVLTPNAAVYSLIFL